MKKLSVIFGILVVLTTIIYNQSSAQSPFPVAVKTCETYTKQGSIEKNNEIFNLLITLQKTKNKCVYKEKIYQDNDFELLTCNFEPAQLPFIADSMTRFTKMFEKEVAKNSIFEAKLTTNGEVFQKYLANPKYCTITHSSKKQSIF